MRAHLILVLGGELKSLFGSHGDVSLPHLIDFLEEAHLAFD